MEQAATRNSWSLSGTTCQSGRVQQIVQRYERGSFICSASCREEMITLDKWYPLVQPNQYDVKAVAFDKACERVQDEYKQALKAHKIAQETVELDVELYNKRARINTIELEMFADRRRFQIFV